MFFEKSENIFSGIFQAAQAAKRRAWGGNPNKIPIGQNERLAKFGTVVESCSKKVAASSVLYLPLQFRRDILAALCYISAGKGKYANSAGGIFKKIPLTTYKPEQSKNDGDF